jgi:hypothetical protein
MVLGLGLAATVAPLTNTVVSAVPDQQSGLAAAINNAISRGAALLAVAGLGVVLSLTFDQVLDRQISALSLSKSARGRLHDLASNPTGSADLAGLPAPAKEAVETAYTVSFHRTMLTAAGVALLGGIAAALTIRNPVEEHADG